LPRSAALPDRSAFGARASGSPAGWSPLLNAWWMSHTPRRAIIALGGETVSPDNSSSCASAWKTRSMRRKGLDAAQGWRRHAGSSSRPPQVSPCTRRYEAVCSREAANVSSKRPQFAQRSYPPICWTRSDPTPSNQPDVPLHHVAVSRKPRLESEPAQPRRAQGGHAARPRRRANRHSADLAPELSGPTEPVRNPPEEPVGLVESRRIGGFTQRAMKDVWDPWRGYRTVDASFRETWVDRSTLTRPAHTDAPTRARPAGGNRR